MLIGVLIALRRAWRWAAVHPARTLAIASGWHGFPLLVRAPRFASRLPRSRKINSLRDHETTEACDREADFIFCRANERFVGGGVRAAVQRKGEEC
jgi:hypothetical protein